MLLLSLLILLFINSYAGAVSIAGSLAEYNCTLKIPILPGINGSNLSGITFCSETGTLFIIDNGNCEIYEIDTSGILLRTITTSGFVDCEGISHHKGNYFYIAEEGTTGVVHLQIPPGDSGPIYISNTAKFFIATNWANEGLEGVCYCPSDNMIYGVKEKNSPQVYRLTLDSDGIPVAAFANDPFNIEETDGDAADIYALPDGNLLILNQEKSKLTGYSSAGDILSELSLSNMIQPEGVTVDTSSGTIYVTGETRQFCVFKKTVSVKFGINLQNQSLCTKKMNFSRNGNCVLVLQAPQAMTLSISIFNLCGKIVKSIKTNTVKGDNTIAFSLKGIQGNIFFCRIRGTSLNKNQIYKTLKISF